MPWDTSRKFTSLCICSFILIRQVTLVEVLVFNLVQDVINSYVIVGKSMEEVLCIYYTTEMLYMLETLHDVGIIHGDFKPDDLLVRYSR